MTKTQVDAGRRGNGYKNTSISRFIIYPELNNPIPRTERSLELNLARKVSKQSKKDLRGLWETLPVVRTSPTTTVIKEPGVHEVTVRNSDIAKFGTRADRNTELWQFAQRRPLPYDKTTEENIGQHSKDLKKKYRGDIKIRHLQHRMTLLLASPLQIATFLKPYLPESLRSPKQGQIAHVNLR